MSLILFTFKTSPTTTDSICDTLHSFLVFPRTLLSQYLWWRDSDNSKFWSSPLNWSVVFVKHMFHLQYCPFSYPIVSKKGGCFSPPYSLTLSLANTNTHFVKAFVFIQVFHSALAEQCKVKAPVFFFLHMKLITCSNSSLF